MATIKAIIRKSKMKSDKTYPIYVRISEDTRNKYISVGCSVLEKDWDEATGKVKRGNSHYEMINSLILKKLSETDSLVLGARAVSDKDVLKSLKASQEKKIKKYFSKVAEDYLTELEAGGKFNQLEADKPRIRHFMKFLNNRDIEFNDITAALLRKYMTYLKTKNTLKYEKQLLENKKSGAKMVLTKKAEISDRTVMNCLVVILQKPGKLTT